MLRKILSIIIISAVTVIPLTGVSYAESSSDIKADVAATDMDSEVYQKNVSRSLDTLIKLRSKDQKSKLKNYDVYIDDYGMLNIMVPDNTNPDIPYGGQISSTEKSVNISKYEAALKDETNDESGVIYRKVKFSKAYLKNIQNSLTKHMKEFKIVFIGSGSADNKVKIGVNDLSYKGGILEYLNENTAEFDADAVTFEASEDAVLQAKRSYPGREVYWLDSNWVHSGT